MDRPRGRSPRTPIRAGVLRALLVLLVVAGLAGGSLGVVIAQDEPTIYAGCIDPEGMLVSVAEGEEPVAECPEGSAVARWNAQGPAGPQGVEGPQGEPGAQGEDGPQGEAGPPGSARTYFASSQASAAFTVSAVARCDEGDRVSGGGFVQAAGPPSWVVASYPSGGRAWTVTLAVLDGSLTPLEIQAYAVCSDLEPFR
jgi:hypothetical protein